MSFISKRTALLTPPKADVALADAECNAWCESQAHLVHDWLGLDAQTMNRAWNGAIELLKQKGSNVDAVLEELPVVLYAEASVSDEPTPMQRLRVRLAGRIDMNRNNAEAMLRSGKITEWRESVLRANAYAVALDDLNAIAGET